MTKYECNRCGQEFDDQKEFFTEAKVAHETGRHTHHNVVGERPYQKHPDGSPELLNKSMGGLDIGPVEWNEVK